MWRTVITLSTSVGTISGVVLSPNIHSDFTYGSVDVFLKVTSSLARITDEEAIGLRWKMSNEEKSKLGFLISEKGKTHDKKWYTDMMADGFDRTQLDALARYNNQDDMIQYIKFVADRLLVDLN